MGRRIALEAALGLHLAVAVAHGATHGLVPVHLPAWQNLVVLLTTFIGPVVGVALTRRDHPAGVPLFTGSLLGALVVGLILHFLVENPDHVAAVPVGPWQAAFRISAAGVAVTPTIGLLTGAWYWVAHR